MAAMVLPKQTTLRLVVDTSTINQQVKSVTLSQPYLDQVSSFFVSNNCFANLDL